MVLNNKVIRILSALLVIILTIFIIHFTIDFFHPRTTFEIQIGHEEDDELPGMRDNGTLFTNGSQLIALAIYPDQRDPAAIAQLCVTKKGSQQILQEEKIREYAGLAAFPIYLHNLLWSPGDYTITLKRSSTTVQSLDFTLK